MHRRLSEQPNNNTVLSDGTNAIAVYRLELPANFQSLHLIQSGVQKILAQAGPMPEREHLEYKIWLAVHETCTNIIEHAYNGEGDTIQVVFSRYDQPQRVVIDLYDTGTAFDPSLVPAPDLDQAQISGYGLFIIYELMDEVVYETGTGNNHWRLSKTLPGENLRGNV